MRKNIFKPTVFSLVLVLSLVFLSVLGCSEEADGLTFEEMAAKSESARVGCHYVSEQELASFRNADMLLRQGINPMPGGSGEAGELILAYYLTEHGWVSPDDIFDLETLSDIELQ